MEQEIRTYKGRPDNLDKALQEEKDVYGLLDSLQIDYSTIVHKRADDMEVCAKIESQTGVHICKNLFLCNRQQTVFYLLLLPGDKIFKTKYLSSQLSCARLSFAGAEHLEKLLHIKPGSVSPFGLLYDKENLVRLIVDKDLLTKENIGFHPCVNTSTIRLSIEDFLDKVSPAIDHTYTVVSLPSQ